MFKKANEKTEGISIFTFCIYTFPQNKRKIDKQRITLQAYDPVPVINEPLVVY